MSDGFWWQRTSNADWFCEWWRQQVLNRIYQILFPLYISQWNIPQCWCMSNTLCVGKYIRQWLVTINEHVWYRHQKCIDKDPVNTITYCILAISGHVNLHFLAYSCSHVRNKGHTAIVANVVSFGRRQIGKSWIISLCNFYSSVFNSEYPQWWNLNSI